MTINKSAKILDILSRIKNNDKNNDKNFKKSQNNLASKLISINNIDKPAKSGNKSLNDKVYTYSKTSSMSSVMKNGELHSQGKEIINDSTKPYLEVKEMHNGKISQFTISKSNIPYKKPSITDYNFNKKSSKKSGKKSISSRYNKRKTRKISSKAKSRKIKSRKVNVAQEIED